MADSQEEEVTDSQEEAEVGTQEDTFLSKETLKEDHKETDLSGMLLSSTMETPRGQKNTWRHGNYTNESTEGRLKWTICINDLCFFSLTYRDLQPRNGSTPSATGLNKQYKCPMSTTDDYGTTPKRHSSRSLAIHYPKNKPLPS